MRLVDATSPPRTPERAELAAAIERHAAAVEAVRRVGEAREQAAEVVYRASDALRAAEAALKEAQADEDAWLAAKALGEDAGISAADAEAAVTRAANDLAVARRTRDALDERVQRGAAEVERAREAVAKCVTAVAKSEAPAARLLAEARLLQNDLVARRIVLRHLFNSHLVADQEAAELRDFLLFQNHLPAAIGQVEYGNFDSHPAADPWRQALQELRENANAPLPT
jgi:inosine/xanthosine triphosphate pyrophosphatase family protein